MILEIDSKFALAYLKVKAHINMNFFYEYITDEVNIITNLFLANSIAHLDYCHFGDVLAFDNMYRTSEYSVEY